MNIDIAKLLESHRGYMLALANEAYDGSTPLTPDEVRGLTWAHDRATTKTLLDLYRSGGAGNGLGLIPDPAEPSALAHDPRLKPSRRVKAGSKKARDRATKGAATRAANRAAKGNHHPPVPVAEGVVELSPATHLALAKVEGETGGAA